MAFLAEQLTYAYPGVAAPVCKGFTLDAKDGEIIAILGRNGTGKTTLLRMLAGLLPPSAPHMGDSPSAITLFRNGDMVVKADQRTWNDTLIRHSSLVFQDYSKIVFEWQTIQQALHWVRQPDDYYSNVVSLFPFLSLPAAETRYWGRLSGGQKQSLALARGLLRDPEILLLDEPFASIDASFRYEMEESLVRIHSLLGKSHRVVVLVTHDIDEAVFVASRILLVSGPPLQLVKEFEVTTPLSNRDRSFRVSAEFMNVRQKVFDAYFKLPTPAIHQAS